VIGTLRKGGQRSWAFLSGAHLESVPTIPEPRYSFLGKSLVKDNPEFEYALWAASYVEDLIGTTICFLHELIRTKQTVVPAPAATKDEMTELDEIEERLSGQGLKLFCFLKSRTHWTSYDSLRGADGIFNVSDPSPEAISKAITRLNVSLLNSDYTIETSSRRVKLVCLVAKK